MKIFYKNVFHLNKSSYRGMSVSQLCSSRAFCAIGRVKFTRCVVILMLFLSSLQGCSMMTYLHVELLQFLLLARFSQRSFSERRNLSIQQYGSTEWNWRYPDREPREFCGNLWNYCPLTRNERAKRLLIADLRQVVALTTGMLLFKLTFFTHRLHSNLCFVLPNKNLNSASFSQSQCCGLRKILLTRFSS